MPGCSLPDIALYMVDLHNIVYLLMNKNWNVFRVIAIIHKDML